MSKLAPIAFPEDKHATSNPPATFPYTSIHGGEVRAGAQGANRMQQLESMLQEAQGRAAIIEKETYEKAYLAGEKAGMALGRKRGEQILETLQNSLQDAEAKLDIIQQSFAEAAMDVAAFIATQIVGATIESDRGHLWNIAKQAATRLPDTSSLHIAVSPDDYAVFKRLLEAEPSIASLNSDATVEDGRCRIISSQHDMLIDPVGAVHDYLEQLRPTLLQHPDKNTSIEHNHADNQI